MAHTDFLSELLGIEKLRVTGTEIDGAEQITLFVESIAEVASLGIDNHQDTVLLQKQP